MVICESIHRKVVQGLVDSYTMKDNNLLRVHDLGVRNHDGHLSIFPITVWKLSLPPPLGQLPSTCADSVIRVFPGWGLFSSGVVHFWAVLPRPLPSMVHKPCGVTVRGSSHPSKMPNTSGQLKAWGIFSIFPNSQPQLLWNLEYGINMTEPWYAKCGRTTWAILDLRSHMLQNLWFSSIFHYSSHMNIQVKLVVWVKKLEFLEFWLSLLLTLWC